MRHAGGEWGSLHVYPNGDPHRFFVGTFVPAYRAMYAAGLCRRQFFIRYSEGGLHLRWRLLPARGATATEVVRMARRVLRCHRGSPGFRIRMSRYSRVQHYFGETVASVYAELLNERSSAVAVQLVGAMPTASRSRRIVLVAAALAEAVGGCEPANAVALLSRGRTVSPLSASAPAQLAERGAIPQARAMLSAVRPRVAPGVAPLARLISRMAVAGHELEGVPHGLHLLANKSGLGPAAEAVAFDLAIASIHTMEE